MSITGLVFLIAFFAALMMSLVRNPLFGLYAYLAAFYLHPPSRWWGEFIPDLRWSLLAAIVTLLSLMRLPSDLARPPWYATVPAKLMVAFAIWLWVQNLWAVAPEDHIKATVLFSKYLLVFWFTYRLLDTPKKITSFVLVNLLGCAYLGLLGYLSSATVEGRLNGVGGPGIDDANTLSMHLGAIVIASSILLLRADGYRWWTLALSLPLLLNAMVLAGSRGSFVGLLAGGAALWWLKPKSLRSRFYAYAAIGIIAFGSITHEFFWQRMGSITVAIEDKEQADTSAQSRFELLYAQFRMLEECFPLGCGRKGTAELSPRYLEAVWLDDGQRSSHNTVMSVLVEHGLPGIVLMLALFGWVVVAALNAKKLTRDVESVELASLAAGSIGAIGVIIGAGMFTDYVMVEIQVWFAAILASIMGMTVNRTDAHDSKAFIIHRRGLKSLPKYE